MNINFKQINNNRTRIWNRKIEYIVIHDTGNPRKTANAEMHFQYFNNAYRGSSADFFVDDSQILQINDYNLYRSWHCGDGKGKYGITNNNSIGIEICINKKEIDLTLKTTINLTADLMHNLNLDISKVVRHFDASRKNCPNIFSKNNWELWESFKKEIEKKYNEIKIDKDLETIKNAGIIVSPNYWKGKAAETKYFDLFISNVANYIKKKGV